MTENSRPPDPKNELPWLQRQWQRVRDLWARDIIIGQVEKGATNVIIGKNIFQVNVAGRNITPYLLVIMIAALIGVGYLVYPQVDHLWNPWPMTGDFDVAVADFGLLDAQGRMHHSEFGETLSASVFHQLQEAYRTVKQEGGFDLNVLIWHDSLGRADHKNVPLGYIKGATPAARAAAAKALARRIKADMIIYGYVTEETDPESLVLEFYYETQVQAGEPDALWGSYELGAPLTGETSYAANPEVAKRTLVGRLAPRMRALFRITQGLAELLANQPERAVAILQATAEDLQDDWPATDGKEILYYFLGSAAAVARDYPTAIGALDEALRLKADYVPALIALGGVYFDRAQLFQYRSYEPPPEQASCVSRKNVEASDPTQESAMAGTQQAIALLERAVTLAPTSFWPPLADRARLNLGFAYRQLGLWHFNQGNLTSAEADLTQADEILQAALTGFPPEEQPVYYAWTQVGLGTVDRLRAHLALQQAQNETAPDQQKVRRTSAVRWLETAIAHYQQCIDLKEQVAGNPVFQKRVLTCSCIPFQEEAQQVLSTTLEATK
ncbi:MAG: hypothetical protein DYG89_42160 [Caldilinea sp. CFX5]|nr:hypothetical protein [Caldilinea sp. CFX5]